MVSGVLRGREKDVGGEEGRKEQGEHCVWTVCKFHEGWWVVGYHNEVVRVHVGLRAVGARARVLEFREQQAEQGSEIARGAWYMASAIIRGQDDAGPDHLP